MPAVGVWLLFAPLDLARALLFRAAMGQSGWLAAILGIASLGVPTPTAWAADCHEDGNCARAWTVADAASWSGHRDECSVTILFSWRRLEAQSRAGEVAAGVLATLRWDPFLVPESAPEAADHERRSECAQLSVTSSVPIDAFAARARRARERVLDCRFVADADAKEEEALK